MEKSERTILVDYAYAIIFQDCLKTKEQFKLNYGEMRYALSMVLNNIGNMAIAEASEMNLKNIAALQKIEEMGDKESEDMGSKAEQV